MCMDNKELLRYNIINIKKGDFKMKKSIIKTNHKKSIVCFTRWCFRCGGTGRLGNEGCYYCQGTGVIDD